ncbi:hypothetical protein ACQPVP_14200 [Clostridium nigeriense]|uniref:hypothetical protein n=1 Tax=Clostridium nigeriense TaxID=1805470 RepID=UPI003D3469A3
MVQELEKKTYINDEMFLTNGIKAFIKDYERNISDISINESLYIKRYYESKLYTLRYIKSKRSEFKEKINFIEKNIILLNKTFKELEVEKDIRLEKMNEDSEISKEKLEDIRDAILEIKRILDIEMKKVNYIKEQFNSFNKSSLEDENLVYIFISYIKREFNKEKRKLVNNLNFNNLEDMKLILTFEHLKLITKKMIFIERELLGG